MFKILGCKLILLLLISFSLPLTYASTEGPKFPLIFPQKVAWHCFTTEKDPKGGIRETHVVFVADGKRWRSERFSRTKTTYMVAICDGGKYGFAVGKTPQSMIKRSLKKDLLDKFDLRPIFSKLYENLEKTNDFKFKGSSNIGPYACWHFSGSFEGYESQVWIDQVKRIPRQDKIKMPDGYSSLSIFKDFPKEIKSFTGIFDVTNTKTNLIYMVDFQ